jgi:hypothetical protein
MKGPELDGQIYNYAEIRMRIESRTVAIILADLIG